MFCMQVVFQFQARIDSFQRRSKFEQEHKFHVLRMKIQDVTFQQTYVKGQKFVAKCCFNTQPQGPRKGEGRLKKFQLNVECNPTRPFGAIQNVGHIF